MLLLMKYRPIICCQCRNWSVLSFPLSAPVFGLTTDADSPQEPSAQPQSTQGDKQKEQSAIGEHRIDRDLEQAVVDSQEQINDSEAAAPYASEFPLKSPTLFEERRPQSLQKHNQFLSELISKAEESSSKPKDDQIEDDKVASEEKTADADTGYAELGGFTTEIVTGVFDEQPLKLHPFRNFYSGQTYDPEELHPYGIARESLPSRRSRAVPQVHREEVIRQKMDFKNLHFLNNYLSDSGLILSRRQTRLSKQLQTRLERSVKLAQALALLPVLDRRSEFKRRPRRQTEKDFLS